MRKWTKDNNQMKIIVIIILVAYVTTSPILASLVDHIPHDDQDGILKCIFDRDNPVKTINNVKSFCGNETQDNFKCYSSYASFKLCLISNECQYKFDEQEISLDCWNCWVNLITDATEVQEFQKKIQSCAAYEKYMGIYVAVLFFLLTLLAL